LKTQISCCATATQRISETRWGEKVGEKVIPPVIREASARIEVAFRRASPMPPRHIFHERWRAPPVYKSRHEGGDAREMQAEKRQPATLRRRQDKQRLFERSSVPQKCKPIRATAQEEGRCLY